MQFCFERILPASQAVLFAFHEAPDHLALLHHGSRDFRLIHQAGNIQVGSTIWFEITVARIIPVALGFRHTLYEPPYRFAETRIHGPFCRFDHVHEFEETDSGTLVRDRLDVELPLHYGGEWAMAKVVAPAIKRAFVFRADALERLVRTGRLGV